MPIETIAPAAPIYPAIVVGVALGKRAGPLPHDVDDASGLLLRLDHQFGGYACLQMGLVGAVLRLEGNPAQAHRPIEPLVRAFALLPLEADQPTRIWHEFPDLADLSPTSGEAFEQPQLDALGAFLGSYFELPRIIGGHEALVELAINDDTRFFREWQIWRTRTEWPPTPLDPDAIETFTRDELIRVDEGETRLRRALAGLAARLPGVDPRVRAFLVWENSD